jgi:ssDNA thymidine ADP-ribosyltransferase, DarT
MNTGNPLYRIPMLFHFTDRRNLPLIRQLGGLFPLAQLKKNKVSVPAPGGNEWSQDADAQKGMGNYVHLCFCASHPMEWLARKDGRINDSIFLQIDPSVLQFDGVRYTPGVSNKSGMESMPIENAGAVIDFEVLYTRMDWKIPAVMERRKQAEKCEILVPCPIPLSHIRNIDG